MEPFKPARSVTSVFLAIISLVATLPVASATSSSSSQNGRFLIGAWFGNLDDTVLTDSQFDLMKDAGINYVINNPWQPVATNDGNATISRLCTERSMYFTAASSAVAQGTTHTDASLQQMVNDNQNLSNCIGYYLDDEPNSTLLTPLAAEYDKLKTYDPNKAPLVNLYPSYAGATALGGSYADYVSSWVEKVGAANMDYLCYDNYPFLQNAAYRDNYFSDMETIRKVAYENGGIKTGCFIQSGSWNGMRRPTTDELRWNVYTAVAYGIKDINYFTWIAPPYVAPPQGEGMNESVINRDGSKSNLYEPAKEINGEIARLGPTLINLDAVHAYHTANVPQGAEKLPQNFPIKPENQADDAIISLMKTKDNTGYYIMIVNKSMDSAKTMSFQVNASCGITGIEEISNATGNPTACNYGNGKLTATFQAGQGLLFKLDGNAVNPEPVVAPAARLASGVYSGRQTVILTDATTDAEIHYTTDGKYPTADSPAYTGPITVGSSEQNGNYMIRAVAIRNGEISKVSDFHYVISNGSRNVALNKPVTFEKPVIGNQGRPTSVINDGEFDIWSYVGTTDGGSNWAQIDFGDDYLINQVVMCVYYNWTPQNVIIQFSDDPQFQSGVVTVFNSDRNNTLGQGAGADSDYADSDSGHPFHFDTVRARYMRCWTSGAFGNAVWEEIQAYSAPAGGSFNVARGKPVSFGKPAESYGGKPIGVINDGLFDVWSYVDTIGGGSNWAQIDFGDSYDIDKVVMCIYPGWNPDKVLIQFSNDPDFSTGVVTVFNSDRDNTYGQGSGTDAIYADSDQGHTFLFDSVHARYMRCWNSGNWGTGFSVWDEIQAYTADKTAASDTFNFSDLSSNWQVTGGGTWQSANGMLTQTENDTQAGSTRQNWDRSLTYKAKKYQNFILEATLKLGITDTGAPGFAGFGIGKANVTDTQSTAGSGMYVAIEPSGKPIVYVQGTGEYGPPDASIPQYNINSEQHIKIAVIGGLVMLSVNDHPVLTVSNQALDFGEGYLSIQAGLLPVEVKDLSITPLPSEGIPAEAAIDTTAAVTPVNVSLGTNKNDAIGRLPQKIYVTDTSGNKEQVDVAWNCERYNGNTVGTYDFTGILSGLPDGLVNVYQTKALAEVNVVPLAPVADPDSYSYDGSGDLPIHVNLNGGELESLTGNGISAGDYAYADGVLTIRKSYLDTLSGGNYTFTIVTNGGSTNISVSVPDKNRAGSDGTNSQTGAGPASGNNPATGGGGFTLYLLPFAGIAAAASAVLKRGRRSR